MKTHLGATTGLVVAALVLSACGGGNKGDSGGGTDPRMDESATGAKATVVAFWRLVDKGDTDGACAMVDPVRRGPNCADALTQLRAQYPQDVDGYDNTRVGPQGDSKVCLIEFKQPYSQTEGALPGANLGNQTVVFKKDDDGSPAKWWLNDITSLDDSDGALLGEPARASTYTCGS